MKITNLQETPLIDLQMEGAKNVKKQVPISKNDGSPLFAVRVFTLGPGGNTPYHTHPFEHINYIIEGNGKIKKESGEEISVKKGDFALVLPDEKHQYINASDTDSFVLMCAVPKEYE